MAATLLTTVMSRAGGRTLVRGCLARRLGSSRRRVRAGGALATLGRGSGSVRHRADERRSRYKNRSARGKKKVGKCRPSYNLSISWRVYPGDWRPSGPVVWRSLPATKQSSDRRFVGASTLDGDPVW